MTFQETYEVQEDNLLIIKLPDLFKVQTMNCNKIPIFTLSALFFALNLH